MESITRDEAYKAFTEAINCCQLTFSEVSPQLGLNKETARRIGSAFGAGMGHKGTCGCVTGAFMALGLKYGFSENGDFAGRKSFYEIRSEFRKWFIDEFGSVNCPELTQGLYMEDKEELREIVKLGLDKHICAYIVEKTVLKLNEMLNAEE